MWSIFILSVILFMGVADGQYNATCRGTMGPGMITPAHFFDVDKMMGTWHIHSTWVGQMEDVVEPAGRCEEVTLNRTSPTDIFGRETLFNISQGGVVSHDAVMKIQTSVELPFESVWTSYTNDNKTTELVWTQTTYSDWALMYGCQMTKEGTYRYEYFVLWLRNPKRHIEPHTLEILKVVANGYGFPPEHILPQDNSKC